MRGRPLELGVKGHAIRQQATARIALAQLRPTIPEHDIHRHQHDDMHFVLLLAGQYASDARGMPAVCAEPALILNPPGTEHRDRFKSRDGLFVSLTMPFDAWAELACDIQVPDGPLRMDRRALSRAMRLLPELWQWDTASPLAVESIVAELLADRRIEQASARPDAILDRVIERLEDDRAHVPSIRELAALVGLHPVYLARMFRRRFGQSPSEWIRRRRLHRALSAVARGCAVADTAAALGFVDQSHLHRCFVAEFGMTPGAFRRLALGRCEVARIQEHPSGRC
ncbi:Transcriptional regulator, AraC family [Lysobacter dokdonensis DS-58]|uniref:Transcriptional regulator, AraC family n=1 Tax=Lysobacter dokdonensis DS-58 TaxID=1300345 RepID=A0A0A2X5J8_9GAMM|nr:AraC family transcriptional regulator [Lysobacter dokdonensis]KGQ20524.1 Transcriptional regulator, AraC family [Lysobacter dokdonensis DS-58]